MAQDTVLLSPSDVSDAGVERSYQASEAFTPGELIELGGSNDVQKHSTAGGTAVGRFALEAEDYGNDLSDDYSSGETARILTARKGTEINALLPTGSSEVNISEGDLLESAGDGTLQANGTASDSDQNIVAEALEAVDNSGGASEARIRVEVL